MEPTEKFLKGVQRMDELIRALEESTDPAAATARELAQSIVELHGAGLARVLAILRQGGDSGQTILDRFLEDDLVRSLLMLHELHPVDLESRVQLALENVRPLVSGFGCELEVLSVDASSVYLRLQGETAPNDSATATLRELVKEAILEVAPDVMKVDFEDSAAGDLRRFALPVISLPTVTA